MNAGEWAGRSLGERTVDYAERDAILYALAVGAKAAQLDLVFEERLRVLPTFALTLAQWAPDALGSAGAFDTRTAVHGAQRLEVLRPLPRSGELAMKARVRDVWDKGSAAIFDVEVESDCFVAAWSIYAPGAGGFGGDRGPSAPRRASEPARVTVNVPTGENQAALYRLLGDRHHMHVDPVAARAAGQPRPFLHGLCTLAAVLFPIAAGAGAHPADLRRLTGRFAGPVFPGDVVAVAIHPGEAATGFEASIGDRPVLTGGEVSFQ
ncbi:MaoC/PaaZ C-terminal domain-containing protein [Amycolatopsis alba]|uniref:Enoyl-CoA hydratase n=1 Tax=Amycolatopsis alba DSM 44262 TaxID=1125972 RepID=A0A229R9Z7_AMYAL|nr:MaoC/PaaZ C-terminal domain-containing protein [Amycolatopsis alba]OXM43467.1 enoyl-CoA hydratase [Amycolatopsis alba DSM 44262]